jgi:hypothetical protein
LPLLVRQYWFTRALTTAVYGPPLCPWFLRMSCPSTLPLLHGFVPKTCKTRVTDTLSWHPKSLVLPGTSTVEAVTAAAKDLETALLKLRKSKPLTATMQQPFDNMENTHTATLNDMCALFPTTAPANPGDDADLEEPSAAANAANPGQSSQRVATPAEQPQIQRVAPAVEQQSQRVTPAMEQHHNSENTSGETKIDKCFTYGYKKSSHPTNNTKNPQYKKKGPRQHTAPRVPPRKLRSIRRSSRDRRSDYNHHELPASPLRLHQHHNELRREGAQMALG